MSLTSDQIYHRLQAVELTNRVDNNIVCYSRVATAVLITLEISLHRSHSVIEHALLF